MAQRIGARCALLLILSLIVSVLAIPRPALGEPQPATQIDQLGTLPYRVGFGSGDGDAQLVPLNPETLADAGDGVAITLPEIHYAYRWWAVSGDGSTLATYDGRAVVVRDAATLAERRRFETDRDLYWLALSRDGGRLVVMTVGDRQMSGTGATWHTYDLATGILVSTAGGGHAGYLTYWIDPEARSLYQLAWQYPNQPGDGPRHPTLIAFDLDVGRVRARLDLPDILGGGWMADDEAAGEYGGQMPVIYGPAGALLADGTRFVVVHVDRDALTFVDTATMTVERTVSLRRATSIAARLLGALSLLPQDAEAAAVEGATLQAALHPDGRHLYVTGNAWGPDGDDYVYRGLGLRLIDLEQGVIVAEVEGVRFHELQVAPDGRSLYAIGPRPTNSGEYDGAEQAELRRLDAATLGTLASREVDLGSTLELMPPRVLEASAR